MKGNGYDRNNRNYIGSEISEEYCNIIEQRLNDWIKKL